MRNQVTRLLKICLIPCIDSWRLPLPQELAVAAPRRCGHSQFGRALHCWLLFRTRYWWKTGRTLPTLHWFYCCFWAMMGCRRCAVSIGRKKTKEDGQEEYGRSVSASLSNVARERSVKENLIIENKGEERQTKKQKYKRVVRIDVTMRVKNAQCASIRTLTCNPSLSLSSSLPVTLFLSLSFSPSLSFFSFAI